MVRKTCDFNEQEPILQAAASVQKTTRRAPTARDTTPRVKKPLLPKELIEPATTSTPLTEGLTINAAWQLLQNHPQYLLDRVDVTAFCEGLRRLAAFDGKALVFEKDRVLALIDEASQGTSKG